MRPVDYLMPKYIVNDVILSNFQPLPPDTIEDVRAMNATLYNDALHSREGITDFAAYIEQVDTTMGENSFPLFHSFHNGRYTRQVHIPRGFMAVGKIHKYPTSVEILKGKAIVVDETGTRFIKAHDTFVSKPGVKRVVYVIEDMIWEDTHKTEALTVSAAEEDIYAESYEELEDFRVMMRGLGITPEIEKNMLENIDDMIDMPDDSNIEVRGSEIQGRGCFTTKEIETGNIAGVARVKYNRTPLGRYTNHSFKPNAECTVVGHSLQFVALKTIRVDDEITVDYRNAVEKALELDKMLNIENVEVQPCLV